MEKKMILTSVVVLLFLVTACSKRSGTEQAGTPSPVPPSAAPAEQASPVPEPAATPTGQVPATPEAAASAPVETPAAPRPAASSAATAAMSPAEQVPAAPEPVATPVDAPAQAAPEPVEPAESPAAGRVEVGATKPGMTRVGADTCKLCHRLQYESWVSTAHAKRTPPLDCESCHGPGSEYKSISVMKDIEKAKAAGLVMPTKAFCTKVCHQTGWKDEFVARAHAHKPKQ